MKVLDSIDKINEDLKLAVTIGNFDGVHVGHQYLLKELSQKVKEKKQKLVVITFIPHPKMILTPLSSGFLINSYKSRRELLEKNGVDFLIELTFNRDFSTQTPKEFLDDNVLKHHGVESFYLGHDFVFGSNKQGDFTFAQKYCHEKNVKAHQLPCYREKGKVSSSIIRECITSGEVETANQLLGRNFFLEGIIVKGEGRGKKIGFPTANMKITKELIIPQNSVYITKCIHEKMIYQSVTNIGYNPTFKDEQEIHVETHILDFDSDIYGEQLKVEFIKRVRNEKKFSSVNDLISQIENDVLEVKRYYRND